MKVLYNKDRGVVPEFGGSPPLINVPIVIYVNNFNEKTAKEFVEKISQAHNTGQTVIPVVIDSFGGHVHSLIVMMSSIDQSSLPVSTIAIGKAMSCGAILLGYGDIGYRYSSKDSRIMLHDGSATAWGKVEDMKITVKETENLMKDVFKKLSNKCGYKDNHFLKMMEEKKHLDFYMKSNHAKKLKLIDHVGVPDLHVNVSLNMELKF